MDHKIIEIRGNLESYFLLKVQIFRSIKPFSNFFSVFSQVCFLFFFNFKSLRILVGDMQFHIVSVLNSFPSSSLCNSNDSHNLLLRGLNGSGEV